jgi:hypothetical protein
VQAKRYVENGNKFYEASSKRQSCTAGPQKDALRQAYYRLALADIKLAAYGVCAVAPGRQLQPKIPMRW